MSISKIEAKQLLERFVFEDDRPQDWVQDVWGLSPMLGESAAKLLAIFAALIECCPEDELESLIKELYKQYFEDKC